MRRPPALTVWRPWPYFIFCGGDLWKRIENRSWSVTYRGDVLISAGKRWDGPYVLNYVRAIDPQLADDAGQNTSDHPAGIVGVVTLAGVCTLQRSDSPCRCGPWAMMGQCHWQWRNPRLFPEPVEHPGSQGLWQVDDGVWPQVAIQLKAVGRG